MKTKIMTVDLEPDLRSKKSKSIEAVVPKLLDFFEERKIGATFFTVTSLLEKYESEIKEIAKKHEIASHSHTHFWLNKSNAEFEISHSKKVLAEYGIRCDGFRAPKFITTDNHFRLLKKYGYTYDSSKISSRFRVNEVDGVKSLCFPALYSGLTYRKLFYPVSTLFPSSAMTYLHPWEFLKKEDLPSAQSITELILRRNSGVQAWKIFQRWIDDQETQWIGCREWITREKTNHER